MAGSNTTAILTAYLLAKHNKMLKWHQFLIGICFTFDHDFSLSNANLMEALVHTLILMLCSASLALAQQRTLTGTVIGKKGKSLVRTMILVKVNTIANSANADGSFQLSLPEGATTLVGSFAGSKSQEVVADDQTTKRIVRDVAEQSLDDVVVIGYGTARKSGLTGVVVSVRSEQLTHIATSDPVQALQGRAANADINSNSGQTGSGTRIRVRGVGTSTRAIRCA